MKLTERPLLGRKLPKKVKKGKRRQILQSYNTAQFVQYGKIRVKHHTGFYTNTPYDPSLVNTFMLCSRTICRPEKTWGCCYEASRERTFNEVKSSVSQAACKRTRCVFVQGLVLEYPPLPPFNQTRTRTHTSYIFNTHTRTRT